MNNLERRRKQSTLDSRLLTSSQKLGMLTNTFIYGGTKTQGTVKPSVQQCGQILIGLTIHRKAQN